MDDFLILDSGSRRPNNQMKPGGLSGFDYNNEWKSGIPVNSIIHDGKKYRFNFDDGQVQILKNTARGDEVVVSESTAWLQNMSKTQVENYLIDKFQRQESVRQERLKAVQEVNDKMALEAANYNPKGTINHQPTIEERIEALKKDIAGLRQAVWKGYDVDTECSMVEDKHIFEKLWLYMATDEEREIFEMKNYGGNIIISEKNTDNIIEPIRFSGSWNNAKIEGRDPETFLQGMLDLAINAIIDVRPIKTVLPLIKEKEFKVQFPNGDKYLARIGGPDKYSAVELGYKGNSGQFSVIKEMPVVQDVSMSAHISALRNYLINENPALGIDEEHAFSQSRSR